MPIFAQNRTFPIINFYFLRKIVNELCVPIYMSSFLIRIKIKEFCSWLKAAKEQFFAYVYLSSGCHSAHNLSQVLCRILCF